MRLTSRALLVAQGSVALLALVLLLDIRVAVAQQASVDYAAQANEAVFVAKDFAFVSGERLPELRVN
jgi:hypothetical protein